MCACITKGIDGCKRKGHYTTTGNALLEDDKVFHLVRPAEELDEIKSKRGSIKDKSMTKAITEIYLTRLLSVKVLFPLLAYLTCLLTVANGILTFHECCIDHQ